MNNRKGARWAACLLLAAMMLTLVPGIPAAAEEGIALPPVEVEHSDRDYSWLTHTTETYTYDFASTDILTYSRDEKLANASLRTNMIFADGKLACVDGKTFSFGTALFLGDDYGLWGGDLSFRVAYTGGVLSVGTRLEKKAADNGTTGLWFNLTPAGVTVTEPESGLSVAVPGSIPSGEVQALVEDRVDTVTLSLDGKVVCSVAYTGVTGALVVCDVDGQELGRIAGTGLNPAGYVTLWADSFAGTVDDFSFTHTAVTDTTELSGDHVMDYSTWVATDDRDRTTPTGEETGDVREDKQVGLFYFLCWTGGDDSEFPRDITDLYLTRGLDGLKSYLADQNNGGAHYWAEPYFGYYQNTDTWVYRKHAYMLEAAGVDFIFLDVTNGATYPEGMIALFDTWLEIRQEGHDTPDICIFAGSSIEAVLNSLRGSIFSEAGWEKYSELFYEYEGKPLFLGDYARASANNQAFLSEKCTVRGCWAWQDQDGYWSWLQEYKMNDDGTVSYVNGGPGRDADGNFEALALCVGHHPTTSKGRSYANTIFPEVNNDFGFSLDSGAGAGFEAQFQAIMQLDPSLILLTGWNEWIAGLNWGGEAIFAGTRVKERYYMVDQFNTEYSRDAEPMRLRAGEATVGFGDNYYYQMVSMIRTFKGWDSVTGATGQGTVLLNDAASWETVGPEYRDSVGDTALRHSQGYFTNTVYVNNTGRNDFDTAKVSQDAEYLYFTVRCVNDIVVDDGANWMNLFIDLDGDSATGWEGYDFVLNRARDSHYVAIESLADGWAGVSVGQALYTLSGDTMTIRVSKAALGVSGWQSSFLFKWADQSTLSGNVMEFMDLGDTAPNDRFAYLYSASEEVTSSTPVTYTLLAADGSTEPLRDETVPLPGIEVPTPPVTGEDTETETEPATSEPVTDPEDTHAATAEPTDTDTDAAPVTVLKYSTTLKVTIVLTGAVLGVCAFLLITTLGKKRK